MTNNFTIDEIVIRVMPGGFLLAIIFFIYGTDAPLELYWNFDVLVTFLFFCSAFIVGELLQTLAHEFEWVIDLFFRTRRPSEVFLYKKNPVINNEHKRRELIENLKLSSEQKAIFEKEYKTLSPLWWGKKKTDDKLSQSIFWMIYSQVSDNDEIKTSNRSYLFTRVMMVEFLLVSVLFFIGKENGLGISSAVVWLVFLWRSRGTARGLVFKAVLLKLRER